MNFKIDSIENDILYVALLHYEESGSEYSIREGCMKLRIRLQFEHGKSYDTVEDRLRAIENLLKGDL